MSRPTPFDVVFGELAEARFPAVREEAARGGVDTSDRVQFAGLSEAQRMLHDLEDPEIVAANPHAAQEYVNLLYAAFRYWVAGRPLVTLDSAALGARLARGAGGMPRLDTTACYVQLPERRFWAQPDPVGPHEPMDGVFVARRRDAREFTVVAVLGLRRERSGFSQVSVIAAPDDFAAAPREARHPPFQPVLQGGERAGVHSIVSSAELLLLVSLALRGTET